MQHSNKNTSYYLTQLSDESAIRLKILIGKFLERNRIFQWKDAKGELISVEQLNQLNRVELASTFLKERLKVSSIEEMESLRFCFTSPITMEDLTDQVAKHIDLKLPSHYWFRLNKNKTVYANQIRNYYPGIQSIPQCEFAYRCNYILDIRLTKAEETVMKSYASIRQINKLDNLAFERQYRLKKRKLTQQEVSQLTQALLSGVIPVHLKDYLTTDADYYSVENRYVIQPYPEKY